MKMVYVILGMKGYYPTIKDARAHIYRYGKEGKSYELHKYSYTGRLGSFVMLEPQGFSRNRMRKKNGIWLWESYARKTKDFVVSKVRKDGSLERM